MASASKCPYRCPDFCPRHRPPAPPGTQRARLLTPVTHDVGAGSAGGRDLKPRRGGRTAWTPYPCLGPYGVGPHDPGCAPLTASGRLRLLPTGVRGRRVAIYAAPGSFVLHLCSVLRIKDSALRHGLTRETISHAHDMAVAGALIDSDNEPRKLLIIGPDEAGNLLELIGADFPIGERVIWHADQLSPQYHHLLPGTRGAR